MKVIRKTVIDVEEFEIGDQIKINLEGYGEFTLTAQKIMNDGTLFIFNQTIGRYPMNFKLTNKYGYEASDLSKWLQHEFIKAFPSDIRNRIKEITIPSYGQIFGHDDFYNNFEPDDDEQFELMKNPRNRIATDSEGYPRWYWLKNATKKSVSAYYFAAVDYIGHADYAYADLDGDVRPVILLK